MVVRLYFERMLRAQVGAGKIGTAGGVAAIVSFTSWNSSNISSSEKKNADGSVFTNACN